jgi:23S rRNA (cytidine1920-2'-O)/16S rRNA (cytidine1409-2'-O)-methyltransferase
LESYGRCDPSRAQAQQASSFNRVRLVNFMANASRHKQSVSVRRRADVALCERGFATTRAKAQELIRRRRVRANKVLVTKASMPVDADTDLEVTTARDFVSRAGHKLDAALDDFGLDVRGLVIVDVGASTGGFTDCVLSRGARRVYAVDVGEGQIDARLRRDERVVVRDRTNARRLSASDFDEPIDVIVADASFISLDKLADAFCRVLPPGALLVALVKPEFEIGRAAARRTRGVVRDPGLREAAIASARGALESAGFSVIGECDSGVPGKKGNVERFIYARRHKTIAQTS